MRGVWILLVLTALVSACSRGADATAAAVDGHGTGGKPASSAAAAASSAGTGGGAGAGSGAGTGSAIGGASAASGSVTPMSNVDTANGAASQVGGAPASSVAVATTPGVDAGQPPLPPVPCPAEVELPLTALEGRVECAGGTGCTLRATTDADAFDVVCDCVDGVWNDCSVDQCPGTWPDREENTCPPKGLALPEGCSCVGQHWESQEIGQDCVCRQELPKPVDPDAGAASGPVLGCPDTAKFSFTEECGANTVCLNRECAEATTCVMRAGAFAANLECDCVDGAWANCRFLECPAVQGTFFGCAETDLALPEGCTCETGMTDNPDVPGEQIATCTCTQL